MTSGEPRFAGLALRDRAVQFLNERGEVNEDELLAHVYGGAAPRQLRDALAAPLLADPRLERRDDGWWSLRARERRIDHDFTALGLVATGPTPARARVVRLTALAVVDGAVAERFDAVLNPERRVPRYVAERVGLEPEALEAQPIFADVVDRLVRFLGDRPVLAQDARLTWAFLEAEARRLERPLASPPLLDLNELAIRLLKPGGKPSLATVAARLGLTSTHLVRVDEEARVLALAGVRLLAIGETAQPDVVDSALSKTPLLRRGATARALPEEAGVYVLRDQAQNALYVGKARRLRQRLTAYIHRPLGATRRLEGLVGSVEEVDSLKCATDLEALVLEDREIRRLEPRFNTVRRQHTPRYWIRLPPFVEKRATPRLELSLGPLSGEAGEFVGPFRNETIANQARHLAREVFELDALRQRNRSMYIERIRLAWSFLNGSSAVAESLARARSLKLLRQVLRFDVNGTLLPADPRQARYAVLRAGIACTEGFVIDSAVCLAFATVQHDGDAFAFAHRLLDRSEPRTTPADADVVLRWFGAQRPPARLVLLADNNDDAAITIAAAVSDLTLGET